VQSVVAAQAIDIVWLFAKQSATDAFANLL
jgi:hypothetical protein